MRSKIEELLSRPKILYSAAVICVVFFLSVCFTLNESIKHNAALPDPVNFSYIKINLSEEIEPTSEIQIIVPTNKYNSSFNG